MKMEREPVDSIRNRYITSTLMSLLSFCCGNAIGWLSPNLLHFQKEDGPLNVIPSENDMSIMASSLCIGAFIATPVFAFTMDKYGRKVTALASSVFFMLSWIITIGGKSSEYIWLARSISGAGCAGSILVVPTYLMEISKTPKTPSVQFMTVVAQNAGILSAYITATFGDYILVVSYQTFLPVLFFVVFVWMPESPVYLTNQKKYKEALETIAWLMSSPLNNENVKSVLNDLKQTQILELQNRHKNKSLFTRETLRCLAKYLIIFNIPSYAGVFALLTYSTLIYTETGGLFSPRIMSIVLVLQQLVLSLASVLFLRKRNKKVKFMVTLTINTIANFGLGTFIYFKQNGHDLSSIGFIPMMTGIMMVATFAAGISVVPFQIAKPEINPRAWSFMQPAIFMLIWISAFLITQFYFSITRAIGLYGLFWSIGSCTLFGLIFSYFSVPFNDANSDAYTVNSGSSNGKQNQDENTTLDTLL